MTEHPYCPPVPTIVALLRHRATHQPDRLGYTWLIDGENRRDTRTWAALDLRARAVAAWLQERHGRGERVLLMFEEGNPFLDALFGCMYAGALAVPVHPPDPSRLHRTLPRLQQICADAGVRFVLTTRGILQSARPHLASDPTLGSADWLAVDTLDGSGADAWVDPQLGRDDLAYLQYTSGSTATPKGVMISHHNLLHQLTDFDVGYDHDPDSVLVTWLPATHDLGLVYGRLMPLFIGFHCVYMSPVAFMQRPLRWLQAIHEFRGTHTPSPNFGFEVVVHKTTPEQRAALDLSSLKVALNGAEPIRDRSEALFIEALIPSGLRPSAVTHAMGMSESTAKILTEPIDRYPARFVSVDPAAYEDGRVALVDPSAPNARTIASCGVTVLDTRVEIVDPDTFDKLPPDRVGEMWVSGTTVAQGYYKNEVATEETFRAHTSDGDGPFLRTGDLAFRHDGEVYLSGRLKDLIIVRGQNHHPQDIEWTAAAATDVLRPNCAAAFGMAVDGEERLGLVAEVYTEKVGDPEAVFGRLRQAIFEEHGLQPAAIALLEPRALPKTSSGKIQRSLARRRFLEDDLEIVARWDAPRAPTQAAPVAPASIADKLDAASGRRAHALLSTFIAEQAALLLGLDVGDIESDRPFQELGLDSVSAVDLVERVGSAVGLRVDGTALFDHPTVDDLAAWLLEERRGARQRASSAAVADMSDEEAAAAILAELEDL